MLMMLAHQVLVNRAGNLSSQLLSVQYIHAFVTTQSSYFGFGNQSPTSDTVVVLYAALTHAEVQLSEGYDDWEALIGPARETLWLLERSL